MELKIAITLVAGSGIFLMIIDTFINDLTIFFHVTSGRMKTPLISSAWSSP